MESHLNIKDKSILIVDDNAINILVIEAMLEEEGFANTFQASNAIDAYEVIDTQEIDLILMDIIMPDINGLEATEAIKSNKKFSHIPIIMVTATEDDDDLRTSFSLGAVDFIRKPVNKVELIARISTILESQHKDVLLLQHSRFDAMEEIIGMLAHQWRQPLSIVHAIISTLQTQRELGILDDESLNNSLNGIIKHTNNLSDMITTFREFFKSSSTPSLANPNDAIMETLSILKEGLEHEDIIVELDLGDLEPVCYVQSLLTQVITNLIINSKEAHVLHKTDKPYILIHSYLQKSKVNILIEDNAGGIAADALSQVFEPYFSTKQEKNGKGLGLFLAKTILTQKLNGNISVTSKNGKSKFLISFVV